MKKNLFFLFILFGHFIMSCNKTEDTLVSNEIFARKSVDNYNGHAIKLSGYDITKAPQLLWTEKKINYSKFSNPVIINNVIYAPSNDEGLVKVGLNTGEGLLSIPDLEINQGQIVYDNGVIYFASDENIIAYNFRNEKVIWNVKIGNSLVSLPLITKDLVIIGDDLDGVYALNKNDGKLIWFYELTNGIDYLGGIGGDETSIFFGGRDGSIFCLDTKTGKEKWVFQTCSDPISCSLVATPTISNGVVYAGDFAGKIFALDRNTGNKIWSKIYDSFIDWHNIAVNDKYIIITGASPSTGLKGNYIICLDKLNGNEIWKFKKDAVSIHEYISDPYIINNNYVLFATDDGISLMDINSKKIYWTISQGNAVNNNTAVFGYAIANGRLVYVSRNGDLTCFGLK